MRRWAVALSLFVLIGLPVFPAGPAAAASAKTPAEMAEGQKLFADHCAKCHGPNGVGTDKGPPLVHKIYEPNHHGDYSFFRAVEMGVRAHHWKFGDMPPVPGLDTEKVGKIVEYIRWLQREAGIF
jgi:mono/diheme cytochrome c family protein